VLLCQHLDEPERRIAKQLFISSQLIEIEQMNWRKFGSLTIKALLVKPRSFFKISLCFSLACKIYEILHSLRKLMS